MSATPQSAIAAELLERVRTALYEHAFTPFENTQENRERVAKAVDEHMRKYVKSSDIDARLVDDYSVKFTKRGAKVLLLSEGKTVEQHKARSGRIANLIGKYHKNNTIVATFTVMPVSVPREVNIESATLT